MQNKAIKKRMQKSMSDLVLHKSTSSLEKLDDNFYGAFQQHYEFLMDKGLIETCQHSGTQKTDTQNLTANVSYREFMHQFNQIKNWLDQLRGFRLTNKASSSFCEKYSNQAFYQEILKRSPRRELLNEYACHLIKYHPNLKHDVLSKLHHLNKKWKSIESILTKRYFNQDMAKDLGEDLKSFQLWLATVENLLENLSINPEWTLSEIEHSLNEHKCLQNDIESHAKIINSVLKLSAKLNQEHKEYAILYENGMYLQNKWHCLWLKSLEWQCRLEQEVNRKKKVQIRDASDQKSHSSEPNTCIVKTGHSLDNLTKLSFQCTDQTEYQNDDIIPFDESEYEKILTSSTATTLNIRPNKKFHPSNSLVYLNYLKESFANDPRKTMSCTNIFESCELRRKIPTSLTESEISKRVDMLDRRKKRRFTNHITNDLSYYYSLTDVKYYSLEDDEENGSDSASDVSDIPSVEQSKKSDSSSSISSLDLSYQKPTIYKYPTNRSISEYNLRQSRNRVFKRYINKKYSVIRRKKPIDLNETGGHDADLDDNLEEADDLNLDDYDYDNSHELVDYDRHHLAYGCNGKKSMRKLNTTATSAYDTCSNLSNEMTSSEKAFRAKSGRSSSGNASGDFNEDYSSQIQVISFTESSNFDNYEPINEAKETDKTEPSTIVIERNEPVLVGVDETSTTNTDVSDPHWDGYTSSPFYSNSVTVDDFCFSDKNQPVLPWDELFFELDPNEDIPIKTNTIQYTSPRQRIRCTRRVSTPGISQTTYHENKKPKVHRRLIDKKDSLSSFECSSSNETTTSDFKNSFGQRRRMAFNHQYRILELELGELQDIINDSEDQLSHVTKLTCWHKRINFELKSTISLLNSAELNRQDSLANNQFSSTRIHIPKYNDLLAICHTNISNLKLIRNLIKTSNYKDSTDTVQPTFTYHFELKQHQQFQQFKQQKLDSYLSSLDDIVNKWEMMESRLRESKNLDESGSNLLNELKSIKDSLQFVHKLTNLDPHVLYFKSLENLGLFLGELEDKAFFLSDILNKLSEQRSLYLGFLAKEQSADKDTKAFLDLIGKEIDAMEEAHKKASLDLKIVIKNLKNLHITWTQVEEIRNQVENQLGEYESELALDCSSCESGCSLIQSEETTLKNLNNKNLMDKLSQTALNQLDLNLSAMQSQLNTFSRELTNLFKFSPDTITETDLQSVYSKFCLDLDKFKIETSYLRELLRQKDELTKKSHLVNTINQQIDLNSNKIRTNASFNYEHGDFFAKLQLDFNESETGYDELKTSTPRYRHIEIENTICPTQRGKIKQKADSVSLENKSSQTERMDKIDKSGGQRSVDSGIITTLDSTDMGSFLASTPSYMTKVESSAENVSSHRSELKQIEKLDLFNKDLEQDDNLRKRNLEFCDKIDEFQPDEDTRAPQSQTAIDKIGSIFSFNNIFFYGFFFGLIFVFFVYSVMPKIMPSCCDFRRDYLFFNVGTLFGDDEDRLVPF